MKHDRLPPYNAIQWDRVLGIGIGILTPFRYPQDVHDANTPPVNPWGEVPHKQADTRDIVLMMLGEYARIGLFVYGLTHPNIWEAIAIGTAISVIGMAEQWWAKSIIHDMYAMKN